MSVYDEVNFKSKNEIENKKLPTNEIIKESNLFHNDFIETFTDIKTTEIKELMYLNELEKKQFDYITNHQDSVGPYFFKKMKIFDRNTQMTEKINYMVDYIEDEYQILTPHNLKSIFEDKLGIKELSEIDYEDIIYFYFKKYQINFKDPEDKNTFKLFLIDILEEEKKEIHDKLPEVKNKEIKSIQDENINKIKI